MKKVMVAAVGLALSATVLASNGGWWVDIANDRIDVIKTDLAQGDDPNAVNPDGQPAIMLAIRNGAWRVYDLLAAHKRLNVNIENRNGETPLMYLAIVGEVRRAEALIKRGAQVNRLGWTPLHYAASKGQEDMVRMLLSKKALPNAPGPDGTTPLMMAALSGNETVVRQLLQAGADVTTRNLKGQDAVTWARLRDHRELADKLDALKKKVLAERATRRVREPTAEDGSQDGAAGMAGVASNQAGTGAGSGNGQGLTTVDLLPPAVIPDGGTDSKKAAPDAQGGSSSRYFNLDRFDGKQDPAY